MDYQYGPNNDNNNYQGNNEYVFYQSNPYSNNPTGGFDKKKEKKGWLVPVCMILSLLMGTAGGALGSGYMMWQYNKEATANEAAVSTEKPEVSISETAPDIQAAQMTAQTGGLSVKQITEIGMPSVVAITNKGEAEIRSLWGTYIQETEGSGSGVIIGKTDKELLIVTNYHVVSGSKELSVMFSYQEGKDISDTEIVRGEIKDYNSAKDLAVIAVDVSKLSAEMLDNIKVAAIGDSNALSLGDQVVAIGNALGYGQSVTSGYISALGRSVFTDDSQDPTGSANKYIQTDAAINPGNSGGALFNMKGELVGINSAKALDIKVEGIGYSIPISDIKDDMELMMQQETKQVVAEEERGYLGITGANVTSEINQAYDIPIGAHISSISPGSPAEAAGLQRGMVITAIDNRTVRTIEELKKYLTYYKAGETVTITAQVMAETGYEEKKFQVTLYTAKEAGIVQDNGTQQQQEQQPQQEVPSDPYGSYNPFEDFFRFFEY